jgi:ketosteroid isomerase-like protein
VSDAEIKGLEDERFRAMVGADEAALKRLLSDQLVYTHSNAGVDSKASLIESILTRRPYQKIESPEREVRSFGDSAVVTGRARIELGGPSPRVLNARYTDVWVKGQEGWQMVAWQSTPIPA